MTRGSPREKASGKTLVEAKTRGKAPAGAARARSGEGSAKASAAPKRTTQSVAFGPETFAFLRALERNNDREWFESHRAQFEAHARAPALRFIAEMAAELTKLSKHFVADPRPVGGSLMRIHRDVRFSADKSPYKTNIGVQFRHDVGKNVHAPGVYLHVATKECFLGVGLWHPEPEALAAIRRRIVERPSEWAKVRGGTAFKNAWRLEGESLARPPRGFDPEHPHVADLKRKDHIAAASLTPAELADVDLTNKVGRRLIAAGDYMKFLCTALELPF